MLGCIQTCDFLLCGYTQTEDLLDNQECDCNCNGCPCGCCKHTCQLNTKELESTTIEKTK